MIEPHDRQTALDLVREAVHAGASHRKACEVLDVDERTVRRWKRHLRAGSELQDRRRESAGARVPANRLTEGEKARIIQVCNQEEYCSSPPSQIVPRLADQGIYIASESSFYRVLHQASQLHRRGRARAPRTVIKPKGYKAEAPNQVWSWDITYLASAVRGSFYYLYMVEDIHSRKIVGWEVREQENAKHASELIQKGCLAEGVCRKGLVLHSDNGSPMEIERHISYTGGFGRPTADRAAIARAFIAKAVYNIPTTQMLLDRLESDIRLRRICGWEKKSDIPSQSTFSRAFAEFAQSHLPERVHAAIIDTHLGEQLVGHISRDGTEILGRKKPNKQEVVEVQPKQPKKQGRPKKGEERSKKLTRLERQSASMSLEQMKADP